MISEAALEDLKELYRNVLGKTISRDEARERGERLLSLLDLARFASNTKMDERSDGIRAQH